MGIEKFLDHKCDIYHLQNNSNDIGWGLPSKTTLKYNDTPDLEDIDCHFGVKNDNVSITQDEPEAFLIRSLSLTLAIGTDIRINDKVVDKNNNLKYTVTMARPIRNHHMKCKLERKNNIVGAL